MVVRLILCFLLENDTVLYCPEVVRLSAMENRKQDQRSAEVIGHVHSKNQVVGILVGLLLGVILSLVYLTWVV